MTVEELRQELSFLPDDAEVVLYDHVYSFGNICRCLVVDGVDKAYTVGDPAAVILVLTPDTKRLSASEIEKRKLKINKIRKKGRFVP